MSNRFDILFDIGKNIYKTQWPIIISGGRLLKDSISNNLIIQLKFHNISTKVIKGLIVNLKTYDLLNTPLEEISYHYLDINIDDGVSFGQDKAILVKNKTVRRFKVVDINVIFDDSNNLLAVADPITFLPSQPALSKKLNDTHLLEQYKIETSIKSKYIPIEYNEIWGCSCGTWNGSSCCSVCGISKTIIFDKLNQEVLCNNYTIRKAIAEECEQKKKDNIQKITTIASIIILLLISISLTITKIIIPFYWETQTQRDYISSGYMHSVALKKNGTVVAVGRNTNGECDLQTWNKIVEISAGGGHTIGLKKDYTVVACGNNKDAQCEVSTWKDIIKVSAGSSYSVGLKKDGTVVATGSNHQGQCNVSHWKNIIDISTGDFHTIGLRKDGTVVVAGNILFEECDVSNWHDIVSISAGSHHTVGLTRNGTVVAVGDNSWGQCDVSQWQDIVEISAGISHTVGLKKDGTVVAAGSNHMRECDVSQWQDIVEISAWSGCTIGLTKKGTVIATGDNEHGKCNVQEWNNIKTPKQKHY